LRTIQHGNRHLVANLIITPTRFVKFLGVTFDICYGFALTPSRPAVMYDSLESAAVVSVACSVNAALWSSVFCCCTPVDLEFAARQSLWLRTEFQHFQASPVWRYSFLQIFWECCI